VPGYRYTNYLGNVNIGRSTGDKSAETALLEAAANGQDNRVTRILREDVHVDHRDPQGRTALHLAAQFGHEHIARALLSAGCDIDASSRSYGTPICLAALKQHQAIFELLLDRGADIRSLDSAGSLGSLLHAASMGGTVAIVARLVSSGLPVNTFRTVHLNFMEAVLKQKCVSEIMKHGEQCQQGSFTPLQVAAGTGDAEVVACLLWAGADVNAQGRIWSAKGLCNYEDAKESYPGCTPLLMVCLAERINGRADHRYEVLQVLLMHGADIHHCPSWALPLQGAAGTGQVSSIETLARLGVDVNQANQNNGFTPLMYAACTGELAAVRKLIELGADLTARDKDGDTAGMIAKNMNQVDCYRVLESASASAWNTSRGGRKS
jgi:ankyrin repeat protein